MKKLKLFIVAFMTLSVIGACNKQDGSAIDAETVETDVQIKLKFSLPQNIKTLATDPTSTDAGRAAESAVDRVDVFVFSGNGFGTTAIHQSFSGDITPAADGTFESPTLNVMSGDRLIYAAVNLPDKVREQLMNLTTMGNVFENLTMADLVSTSGHLAMFNEADVRVTIPNNIAPGTVFEIDEPIQLSRLVAKFSAQNGMTGATQSLPDWGGSIATSTLAFTVGNTNVLTSVKQLAAVEGVTPVKYRDHNYEEYTATSFNTVASLVTNMTTATVSYAARNTNYIAVNAANAGVNTNSFYSMENTSALTRYIETTFLSVRAKFVPTTVAAGENTTTTGDFVALFYATGNSFNVEYFYTAALANDAFATRGGIWTTAPASTSSLADIQSAVVAPTSPAVLLAYPAGMTFYRVNLNAGGNNGSAAYDILRNYAYNVNITAINGLGTNHPDKINGEPGTPLNPGGSLTPAVDPIDPTDPITPGASSTDITVSFQILPWTYNVANYQLN